MALAELIITRYPKDTLDILVFGNDAKIIPLKQLPYFSRLSHKHCCWITTSDGYTKKEKK